MSIPLKLLFSLICSIIHPHSIYCQGLRLISLRLKAGVLWRSSIIGVLHRPGLRTYLK